MEECLENLASQHEIHCVRFLGDFLKVGAFLQRSGRDPTFRPLIEPRSSVPSVPAFAAVVCLALAPCC